MYVVPDIALRILVISWVIKTSCFEEVTLGGFLIAPGQGPVTGKAKPRLEAWNLLCHPTCSRGQEGARDGVNGMNLHENPQSTGW